MNANRAAVRRRVACATYTLLGLAACAADHGVQPLGDRPAPRLLSDHRLFVGRLRDLTPNQGVLPYAVNTELFSDYAVKRRFVWLPPGTTAGWHDHEALDLPVGTILVKSFGYPAEPSRPDGEVRWLETRLLVRQRSGWVGLPYVWNDDQAEAELRLGGTSLPVAMVEPDGTPHALDYLVPNTNMCGTCHNESGALGPLGVKVRHLNRDYAYASGPANQLDRWRALGWLRGGTAAAAAPRSPCADDPASGTLDARARAWLDVNCAGCHSPAGRAGSSGMWLGDAIQDPLALGIGKPPISAGKGTGGRRVGIAPGEPDESVLLYRIESTEPGVAMPELGRTLMPKEGAALIRQWIAAMR